MFDSSFISTIGIRLEQWLGAFVNNGASHIQGLASNIDKLCAELGSTMTTNDGADSSRSASLSLLHDVRQLVLGMKARDQNMASLQAVLNDLITAIGPETRHGAGMSPSLPDILACARV